MHAGSGLQTKPAVFFRLHSVGFKLRILAARTRSNLPKLSAGQSHVSENPPPLKSGRFTL